MRCARGWAKTGLMEDIHIIMRAAQGATVCAAELIDIRSAARYTARISARLYNTKLGLPYHLTHSVLLRRQRCYQY
jgi:hypothetical protein